MILELIKQTIKGKTVNRILMNLSLGDYEIGGRVLDLGAGNVRSSYIHYLRKKEPLTITSLDISKSRKPDVIADLEKELPLESESFDFVLCINLLEHIYNHGQLLSEINRVLKPGGQLIGYVPFLVKFHPDPNDYFRYTEQGLKKLMGDAGFPEANSAVKFIGRGPILSAWSQFEYVLPRFARWPFTLLAMLKDLLLLSLKPIFRNKYPLGYVFSAKK